MATFVYEENLHIDAPAAIVWEVITDLPRYGEWNPFVSRCQSTLQPGDPIDMTVHLMARPQQQREWITDYDDGHGFAYRMKPVPLGALSSARWHDIRPDGEGRSRYQSHFELRGWMMPVVRGLLGARLRAGFAGMNAAVKQRAEALWAQRQR
ncbi:SRPBCC domain-containing protein [Algiphilus sp. NNCM1]|uniref:SRPBCC domain-containing protein n=1 Tax=Algiphilus sp. TaxID=1872431 RepID=UPI001CA6339A|nr:SRPBCC domain-containing protein [Algiphilus sp.]MBY8966864.1 SRPBCC domain-containing protein [Algiphilus acroporae]MCI5063044.1 SRPBCC domain-containing protein [Algiphilus sp.]MCI5104465.1 SRPBCC domain-containing protein [Algiphilus sp.]